MNTLLTLSLVTLISTIGFSQSPNGRFEITGKLSGIADSTWIYLEARNGTQATNLDSALVIDGRFHLKGALTLEVDYVLLFTHDYSDYTFFWLENTAITFTAEKGKFKQAAITGSTTQDEQQQLNMSVRSGGNEKKEDLLFIRTHPNSMVSANILNVYASTWGKDTAEMMFNKPATTMNLVP